MTNDDSNTTYAFQVAKAIVDRIRAQHAARAQVVLHDDQPMLMA
jgi:hypothetical protein